MAKKVTVIPATIPQIKSDIDVDLPEKRRVAGYARVSTDMVEQQSSYEAQMKYYSTYIQGRNDWEFVGMYSDEGISATSTKHREGFNKMVEDALAGKIDLIITKSVSRFARNTVDSLTTVRKLKERGIEIYFEKENIWTLDAKGELLITIMSSLAQEESRSISENTTWGHRKRFADGKWSVAYSRFLGYTKNAAGEVVIVPEEAETVREIYRLFLEGLSYRAIAKQLEIEGKKTATGKDRWHSDVVQSILMNEKYAGNAICQKYYTTDFLTKKIKPNEGELPQYFVEGDHPAIIEPNTFDLVQAGIEQRTGKKTGGLTIFSSRIICGQCGGIYGPKVWHSNESCRKVIWRCNHKYGEHGREGTSCETPHLTEKEIKTVFLRAMDSIKDEKEEIIANTEELIQMTTDTKDLRERLSAVSDKLTVLAEKMNIVIARNMSEALDQSEYNRAFIKMEDEEAKLQAEHDELSKKIADLNAKRVVMKNFVETFDAVDNIDFFDDGIWGSLVDTLTVNSRTDMVLKLKGGLEIKTGLEK